jgi:hypothetical protein
MVSQTLENKLQNLTLTLNLQQLLLLALCGPSPATTRSRSPICGCESAEHSECPPMQCVFPPHVFLLVPSYSFKFYILSDRVSIALWSDLPRLYNSILCNGRSSHNLPTNILHNPTSHSALSRPIQGPSSAILLPWKTRRCGECDRRCLGHVLGYHLLFPHRYACDKS